MRLSLNNPEMFRVQIRAALKAAAHTKLNLMFPMVAQVDEFKRAKDLVLEEMDPSLKDNVAIGVMVEGALGRPQRPEPGQRGGLLLHWDQRPDPIHLGHGPGPQRPVQTG